MRFPRKIVIVSVRKAVAFPYGIDYNRVRCYLTEGWYPYAETNCKQFQEHGVRLLPRLHHAGHREQPLPALLRHLPDPLSYFLRPDLRADPVQLRHAGRHRRARRALRRPHRLPARRRPRAFSRLFRPDDDGRPAERAARAVHRPCHRNDHQRRRRRFDRGHHQPDRRVLPGRREGLRDEPAALVLLLGAGRRRSRHDAAAAPDRRGSLVRDPGALVCCCRFTTCSASSRCR